MRDWIWNWISSSSAASSLFGRNTAAMRFIQDMSTPFPDPVTPPRLILIGEPEHTGDSLGQCGPVFLFFRQLFPSGGRNGVEPRASVVVGCAPLRGQPTRLHHAVQSRIK